ncbi:hypothetical protein BT96DRAFT_945920 [Gymnopus androsaceus JB14]|uniref:Uncharacterized protein n=1 Tax=Gymnopus androsaceus JB14 TaxID=1447944 RepID=A0A6A4GZ02_9AGAR|nr:hypothetical protein BT96DRAFT_945920 [Gymnopus androsaceus JB14]
MTSKYLEVHSKLRVETFTTKHLTAYGFINFLSLKAIAYYCKMRLSSAPPDYYIVGCIKPGSPGETSHIVRRFKWEEDRDHFESMLNKFGWSPFTSKPLWKLTVNGDPCLAVSSAGSDAKANF